MTISVIVPVYDGARYLRESVDSVLGDSYPARRVIVVDDGSTDETPEVIASYGSRISAIRQEHSGLASALNTGLAAADGELVAFQDADDVWPAGRLALLVDALDDQTDLVVGLTEQFVSPELDPAEARSLRVDTRPQLSFLLSASLVRREVFETVGGFDAGLSSGANIDWVSRVRLAGMRTRTIAATVHRRRIHASNMGRTIPETNPNLLRIMRAHLDRHRTAGARPVRHEKGGGA